MNILIIGSGSYVLSDPFGPGVVLRSVLQWTKDSRVAEQQAVTITLTYQSEKKLPEKQSEVEAIINYFNGINDKVKVKFEAASAVKNILAAGDVAACFIAVPDVHHAEYCKLAIEHGCPVWLVKPLTGNYGAAKDLSRICGELSGNVWVDYHKRFDPSNAYLKLKGQAGDYGRMLVYSVDYHQPYTLPTQVFDWTSDVDVFTYIGCHYVDQVFYLYPGARPVSASAYPVKGKVYEKTGQFDGVIATLRFDVEGNELLVPMNIGWFNPAGSPTKSLQVLKVQFEKGLVNLDQTRRGIEIWHEEGVSEINPYFFGEALDAMGNSYYTGYGYKSVQAFLDLVQSGQKWPSSGILPTLEEALKTEKVLFGVQEALKTGKEFDYRTLD
ncbi:Gfo/Idh/MocA family protein [Kordiimonas pumila]|uniref:Gfo/Idh/MocA family protein n=1 Tax=Kordiimonas pumila TaxID=2161677 RepID=A0ABV7D3E3_9PROT|nr:Gfo/Idh/MocA family oxidoreductase [Kordiimonas pumila]